MSMRKVIPEIKGEDQLYYGLYVVGATVMRVLAYPCFISLIQLQLRPKSSNTDDQGTQ